MTFGIFSYLATILIFAGSAVLIEYSLTFKKLKKYKKIIALTAVIGMIGTLIAEPVALNWRIWLYSPDRTFGVYFGAALETFIFTVLVSIAISSATLVWSDYEEKNEPLVKKTFSEVKSKLQKLF